MAGTKKIPLSQGKFAIVDKDDYDWLTGMGRWTYHNQGYAYRWDTTVKPYKCVLMHRLIMEFPVKQDVDHINRNKLDNRRSNLRAVSRSANNLNRSTVGIESSKYSSGYSIRILAAQTRIYIGRFKDRDEAMHISKDVKEQLLEAIL